MGEFPHPGRSGSNGSVSMSRLWPPLCHRSSLPTRRRSTTRPSGVASWSTTRPSVDNHQIRFARHIQHHEIAVVVEAEDELFTAIDRALVRPGDFTVNVGTRAAEGVHRFGSVVDELLGTSAPIVPNSRRRLSNPVSEQRLFGSSAIPTAYTETDRGLPSPSRRPHRLGGHRNP